MMGATEAPPSFGTLDLLEELGAPVEDVPCESRNHDHPADLVMRLTCPRSQVVNTFCVCRPVYYYVSRMPILVCDLRGCDCGAPGTPSQIVSVGEWLR
jgi:hypothetical protein